MDSRGVLMSETAVEPLFQRLVHKVKIDRFNLLRDLAKKKALPDCLEDSEEFFEHGTVLFLGAFGHAACLDLQLWLCPNGDREDWDALTVTISNEGTEDLPDFTKLTILDPKDDTKEISSCETVGICRAKRGYVRFFFNWTDQYILRVGSCLVVKVEMSFLRRMIHIGSEPNQAPCLGSIHSDVFDYLSGTLFKSPYGIQFFFLKVFRVKMKKCSDKVTVNVEAKQIPCSKTLLSCRSPVFEKMFSGNFKEANAESVSLEDIDGETAERLLMWIHEDKLPDSSEMKWSDCMQMLIAADKFQVNQMVDYCIYNLRRLLTQGSVAFNDIIGIRRMLQQSPGLKALQLSRDCEAYVAARAAADPSTMLGILERTEFSRQDK